jgi:hypothetical protein
MALRIANKGGTWAVEELWRTSDAFFHLSNFTLVGDTLYGLSADSQGRYVFVDAKTGAILWGGPGRAADNAAFLNAGNLLLVLEADGDLLVADANNRTELKPLQQYKLGEGNHWAAPAVSRNRIFVKNENAVVLFTVN